MPRNIEKRKEWLRNHRKEHAESQAKYRKRLKIRCLSHYGGNPPKCACCGETTPEFLSIDHINGLGTKHRKENKIIGNGIHWWLVKNKFPVGFQILCHNCNLAKGFYGECPHKRK